MVSARQPRVKVASVKKGFRSKGIGRKLFGRLHSIMLSKGITRIIVQSVSGRARHFYGKKMRYTPMASTLGKSGVFDTDLREYGKTKRQPRKKRGAKPGWQDTIDVRAKSGFSAFAKRTASRKRK